jgi:hypothetical protein
MEDKPTEVTVEEIWEIEKLAGTTCHPYELLAIQELVKSKRAQYKEQQWVEYQKDHPDKDRTRWETWDYTEPPVGYKALQTVEWMIFDVSDKTTEDEQERI